MRCRVLSAALAGSQAEPGGVVLAGGTFLAMLLVVLYRSALWSWLGDLWDDPNYSHGLLVPFVSAWLVYERRDQVAALVPQPAASGFVLILGSIALFMAGLLAAEL